jgi:hypothetical protein
MFTKISCHTAKAVVKTPVSMRKVYRNPDARDDRRAEPSKGELAKMMEAHVTSLDAIIHGFTIAGALHF